MTLEKQLVRRVIDVLELELEVSLDDQEWEAVIDKKLTLLIDLRKFKKAQDEQDQRAV